LPARYGHDEEARLTLANHRQLPRIKEFCTCAVSRGDCDCGNNFQKNGEKGKSPKWKGGQAHHLLPVSAVNSEIRKNEKLEGVMKATKWCINDKNNMLSMPVWGETVKYYCTVSKLKWAYKGKLPPPKFKNIPQHLVDHDLYITEVCDYLAQLVATLETQDHKVEAKDISEELNTWSQIMRDLLDTRGHLKGGTDKCWGRAENGGYDSWYIPFSMSDNPRPRDFPERLDVGIESVRKKLTG
jgi:hypothetical protein